MTAETLPLTTSPGKPSPAPKLESWRRAWRLGIAPQLSTEGLRALEKALRTDDPELIQGATMSPPDLESFQQERVIAACAIAYAGWQGERLQTVQDVEDEFAKVCAGAEQILGDPAAARWFTKWYDDKPRPEMRKILLAEVRLELARRDPPTGGIGKAA